ncbi:MAG: metallophosphoesterase, partial [Pseudomonadota bacterium]
LYGIARFQSVIAQRGAELVLHGHTHLPQRHFVDGPDGQVRVYGVPAASETPGRKRPPGAFNLFRIDRNADNSFSCTHEEWSVDADQKTVLTEENQLY